VSQKNTHKNSDVYDFKFINDHSLNVRGLAKNRLT